MRTFQDSGFHQWETWASSGEHGFSDRHPRLIFRCRTHPDARARQLILEEGDEADAQRQVLNATLDELRTLLDRARPVS